MERILKLTKPMMRGQARQDIRDVQQKLTDLGYPCGPADGIFGPKTLQSVKSFQKDFNLQVDGMVGPQTWASLISITDVVPKTFNPFQKDYPKISASDNFFPVSGNQPPLLKQPPMKTTDQQTGKVCSFGGPYDLDNGDSSLTLYTGTGEQVFKYCGIKGLFLEKQPVNTYGSSKRLNPEAYYIALRWEEYYPEYGGKETSEKVKSFLREAKVIVRNENGRKILTADPVEWGPEEKSGRIGKLSPGLMRDLGLKNDDLATVILP